MAKSIADKDQSPGAQTAPSFSNANFKFAPRQQSVYNALLDRTQSCAKMYFGAIAVLADQNNPERLHLAAHSLRELMNNIGPHLDVPALTPELKKGQGKLNDRVAKLETLLRKAEEPGCNWDGKKWDGPIHKRTIALLVEVQRCVEWRTANEKLRKTNSHSILNTFDPLHKALPKEIQSMHANEWEKTCGYFVSVAHHANTDSEQFAGWLLQLEEMLLKGLMPRMEQNLDDIDAIIKAGETK